MNMLAGSGAVLFLVLSLVTVPSRAAVRDVISVVGSSTVYPFAAVVAERFGRGSRWPAPKVEATGSGGGFKLFCQGIGPATPDITAASRPMLPVERAQCRDNEVIGITELVIGYDGIVVAGATAGELQALSLKDLYLALARWVPAADGSGFVRNPYDTWQQVNPALPATRIRVFGPPPTSGTRDAFDTLAMQQGCREIDAVQALRQSDPKRYQLLCQALREDGAFVEIGERDNLIVRKLEANPQALGILGFSYLDQNRGRLHGVAINGVVPGFRTIASHAYPLARPLYLYVKNAHVGVVPGLSAFVRAFTSEQAVGPEGYLVSKGLIPAPLATRREMARRAAALSPIQAAVLAKES